MMSGIYTWTTHTVDGHDGWNTVRIYRSPQMRDAAIEAAIQEIRTEDPDWYAHVADETIGWTEARSIDQLKLLDFEESFHDIDDDLQFQEDLSEDQREGL